MIGGAVDYRFVSGDFYGQGMQWGGLAGSIAGGGLDGGWRAVAWQTGAGLGAGLGYGVYGTPEGALLGANLGAMGGGITHGVYGRLRSHSASSSYVGRFRGEPFAFGTGVRSERVNNLMNEAASAAGVRLESLVDEIRYVQGNSAFDVVNGRRIVSIGSDAFGQTQNGQLMEALHEIGHAEYFAKRVRSMGRDQAVYETFWGGRFTHGMPAAFREEQVVERLARMRAARHVGGLSPQERAAATRFIRDARQDELRAIAGSLP